jgi:hypothetical protein
MLGISTVSLPLGPGVIGLARESVLKIDLSDIRAGTIVTPGPPMRSAAVAVVDGRKWKCHVWRASKARLAFAHAQHANLGQKFQRLGGRR